MRLILIVVKEGKNDLNLTYMLYLFSFFYWFILDPSSLAKSGISFESLCLAVDSVQHVFTILQSKCITSSDVKYALGFDPKGTDVIPWFRLLKKMALRMGFSVKAIENYCKLHCHTVSQDIARLHHSQDREALH